MSSTVAKSDESESPSYNRIRQYISQSGQMIASIGTTCIVTLPMIWCNNSREVVIGLLSPLGGLRDPIQTVIYNLSQEYGYVGEIVALFLFLCISVYPTQAIHLTRKALTTLVNNVVKLFTIGYNMMTCYNFAVMSVIMCFSAYAMYYNGTTMASLLAPTSTLSTIFSDLFYTPNNTDRTNLWSETLNFVFSMNQSELHGILDNYDNVTSYNDFLSAGSQDGALFETSFNDASAARMNMPSFELTSSTKMQDYLTSAFQYVIGASLIASVSLNVAQFVSPSAVSAISSVSTMAIVPVFTKLKSIDIASKLIKYSGMITTLTVSGAIVLDYYYNNRTSDGDLEEREWVNVNVRKNVGKNYTLTNPERFFSGGTMMFWSLFNGVKHVNTGIVLLMGILKARIDSYINRPDRDVAEIKISEVESAIKRIEHDAQYSKFPYINSVLLKVLLFFCKTFNVIRSGIKLTLGGFQDLISSEFASNAVLLAQVLALTNIVFSSEMGMLPSLGYGFVGYGMSMILAGFIEANSQIGANTALLFSDVALIILDNSLYNPFESQNAIDFNNSPQGNYDSESGKKPKEKLPNKTGFSATASKFINNARNITTSSRFITKTAMRFCDFGHISLYRNAASTSKKYKSQ